jgi:hypothetical protein
VIDQGRAGPGRGRSRLLGLWSVANADNDSAEAALRRIRADHPAGALRNAVLSLVVLVDDPHDTMSARRVGDALGAALPGRVIVVSCLPDGPTNTKTSLVVRLVERDGGPPLCVEQVHLRVGGDAVAHVGAIVRPWLLPGLPVAVWVPAHVPGATEPGVAGADRVLVDSDRLGRVLDDDDLAALRDQPAIDLAWVRLRPWRRLLVDAFAAHELSPMVRGVERADIVGGIPWSALIGGWLASRLDLAPANVRLVAGDRRTVHLWGQLPGRRAEVSLAAVDDHRVRVVTVAGGIERHHVVGLPAASLAADVGAALTVEPGHDPGWEHAAAAATSLAHA